MRYKITLSYSGAPFCGWQIQSRDPSVQGHIEDALTTLTGVKCPVTGAGRTDTGVNASYYVAHFDCDKDLDCGQICYKMNAILPQEIAIFSIERAGDDFHARFSAVSREYKYYIHSGKNPFLKDFSWYCRFPLDLEKMNAACADLIGEHDFSCFEKKGSDNATSICRIDYARWERLDNDRTVFTVRANRFLRNMVRAIVGTMVDIGRGRMDSGCIPELLASGSRGDAGQSVPAHGLFLSDVDYGN